MAASKPTPEEKLFAVIQGGAHPPIRRAKAAAWPALSARMIAAVGALDLPRINQLLLGVAGVLALLCAATPLVLRPNVEQVLLSVAPQPFARIPKPLEGLKTLEEYQQALEAQDPFRVGAAPPPEPVMTTAPTPPLDPRALLGGAKLVGISWGQEPVAMIEQNGQTYFLKAGEALGSLTVKTVLEDRVILRAGETDVELF